MHPAFIGLLAALGIEAVSREETGPVKPGGTTTTPGTTTPTKPRTYSAIRTALQRPYAPGTGVGDIPNTRVNTVNPLATKPTATTANGMDAEAEQAIKDELRRQYESMSGDAKRAACERLKDEFPDDSNVQGLNCDDATFDQVLKVVGAAVGTAVCGPACGALGVIAAEYFGEDINQLWNDYVASIWDAPADHSTETLSLAQACARGDSATKAYLKQQAIARGITPPPECG